MDLRAGRTLVARITRLELAAAALAAAILAGLVVAEPDILQAPFESTRSLTLTFGGTALAGIALLVMLHRRVPPAVRIGVLGVPLVAVSWWLLSPFFLDDVVHDEFDASIAAARTDPGDAAAGPSDAADPGDPEPAPVSPRLLGSGTFVGLAGHDGTGDAGIFDVGGGQLVLRLERFDIDNGPDLRLYLVPGADQRSLAEGATYLGPLRGNVGDQTYELPAGLDLSPGPWTVLVWCEAFAVEFVGATVTVA